MKDVPASIIEAFDHLTATRLVEITKGLREKTPVEGAGRCWQFTAVLEIPSISGTGFSTAVEVRVELHENYPYGKIEIFALADDFRGFAHQDAETGKLCLEDEDRFPRDKSRLVEYIRSVQQWIVDSVTGAIPTVGDPYELPDFSIKKLGYNMPTTFPILFSEDKSTFSSWRDKIGQLGIVKWAYSEFLNSLIVLTFQGNSNQVIHEIAFSSRSMNNEKVYAGRWALLPSIIIEKYRPAQTFRELSVLCAQHKIPLWDLLQKAWQETEPQCGLLLIGFPIPATYGGVFEEIHWQPLLFENVISTRRGVGSKATPKDELLWKRLISTGRFSDESRLPWGLSKNVSSSRMYARSGLSQELRQISTSLFGCGAVGSLVAEALVRGGMQNLNLFDPKVVQFGHLCRHTLYGSSVGQAKAEALANELAKSSPLAEVRGFGVSAPLPFGDEAALNTLERSDLIIECTASKTAFEWLDQYVQDRKKRLASMFISFKAEFFTLCISSSATSCGQAWNRLREDANSGEFTDAELYSRMPTKDEYVFDGIGCWHPTYPGNNVHIQVLVASGLNMLQTMLRRDVACGVIIRRKAQDVEGICNLVECVWYREF